MISVFEISRADSKKFCSITMVTVTVYEYPVGYICIRKRQERSYISYKLWFRSYFFLCIIVLLICCNVQFWK